MKMPFRWSYAARAIALCSALAAAMTSCSKVGSTLTDGRVNSFTQPHVLRVAMDEDLTTLNPWFSSTAALNDIAQMTMAYLFRYNKRNEPQPELALVTPTRANGGVSADGKTITYRLRKGVRWSDGAPFDADDVVYSFHQYLNPHNNVIDLTGWRDISKITKVDRYTVKIALKEPYAVFESTFFSGSGPCILPQHLLKKTTDLNHAPYNAMPVGIGPFRVSEWKRGDEVVLVPNTNYWRGLAKLKRVEFHIVPNINTTFSQLQTGNLDLWMPAPASLIKRYSELQGFRTELKPSYTFAHIDFNLANPALADVRVRQALRYATNRKLLLDKISHGIGLLQESPLSPVYPNAPPVIPMLPYDRDAAAALLDKAGWVFGQNGVRHKNGRELRFEVAMGTGQPSIDAMMELIRGWWQDIGVAIEIKHYDTKLLFAQYNDGGIINKGRFDITLFSWQLDPFDSMYSILGCDSFPPYGQNNTHYCNAAADRLMLAVNKTYDPVVQRRLKGQLFKIFVRDVPMFVTSIRKNIWVANDDLKGFEPTPASSFGDMLYVDI